MQTNPLSHNSVPEIRRLLESRGLTLKKRWGQNFLLRPEIRERIVDLLIGDGQIGESPLIWESGPGLGAMTDILLQRRVPPVVFEIDHGLIRLLKERYSNDVPIVEGDFLKTWNQALDQHGVPRGILGNLPYASGSRMVAQLAEYAPPIPRMVYLIQAELAERLSAGPGTKRYSALSVVVQARYRISLELRVPGSAFYPVPEVESAVVVMRPRDRMPSVEVGHVAAVFARASFAQRRKKIGRLLKAGIPVDKTRTITPESLASALERTGISKDNRPEDIRPEEYVSIAEKLSF